MLRDLLFPASCILCNNPTNRGLELCSQCEQELPLLPNPCSSCARPLPPGQTVCGSCLAHPPPLTKIVVPYSYTIPLPQLIIPLKFNGALINAHLLGSLLAQQLALYYQEHPKPEVIIPVPLHPNRLRTRGYNQALELTRPIAKNLKLPIDIGTLQRSKDTAAQTLLPATQRAHNIKGAFMVAKPFKYKHIAIVDDVITTGHTIYELGKTLIAHGATTIEGWCCAKTTE